MQFSNRFIIGDNKGSGWNEVLTSLRNYFSSSRITTKALKGIRLSSRYVKRAAPALLVFFVITTAFTSFALTVTETCLENRHEESLSMDRIDESLLDFISNSNTLLLQLERAVKDEVRNVAEYSEHIIIDLKKVKRLIHQMEQHIDERAMKLLLSQPSINNHNFAYIHNPVDACSRSKIDVLLVVPSAATNFEKRRMARNGNRGDYVRNKENNAQLLFFLGRPPSVENYVEVQKKIDEEAKEFGDVVQEHFEDIYRNNRLKSVSMLRWVSKFCSNTKYVIRSDDDINANVSLLIPVLDRTSETLSNFIIGKKRVNDPPRRDNNKYYMSEKEYPWRLFPPYLLGGLQGFPSSTARRLYEAALRVKPIWLEDVYITGLCAPKVHVPILTYPEFEFIMSLHN